MSIGNKVVLSYALQSAVDVIPDTGWRELPRVSDSLNNTFQMTDSETITGSRIKTAGMVTSATAEGNVEVEFIKGAYDDLIAAAAGNPWVDNKLTFAGDIRNIFAIQKFNKDIGLYHLWSGLRLNTFSLDIPEEGMIGMTFGMMGQDYKNGSAIYAKGTTAATATSPKATSLSVTDIKIDGVTAKGVSCVTGFTFEIGNNIVRQNCLGAGLYGSNFLEIFADMTGSITLAYSAATQAILNKQATGAPTAIEATIKFPDGSTYVLNIPKAQISGDIPSGGKDKLDAQLTYSVYADTLADAPTLTRTLLP